MRRGVARGEIRDDGTIAPTAAASSIAFAPEIAIPAIEAMAQRNSIYSTYGFLDSFNPTFTRTESRYRWAGAIRSSAGSTSTRLVWETMKKNPHVVRGLKRAWFTGGWLDQK